MRSVIVVRCQNGIVVWQALRRPDRSWEWICMRDRFAVPQADSAETVDAQLLAMAQHSVQLAGAILQLVQLDV